MGDAKHQRWRDEAHGLAERYRLAQERLAELPPGAHNERLHCLKALADLAEALGYGAGEAPAHKERS